MVGGVSGRIRCRSHIQSTKLDFVQFIAPNSFVGEEADDMRLPWLPLYAGGLSLALAMLGFPTVLVTVCTLHNGCYVRVSPYALPVGVLDLVLALLGVSAGTRGIMERIRPMWPSAGGMVLGLATAALWVFVLSNCMPIRIR